MIIHKKMLLIQLIVCDNLIKRKGDYMSERVINYGSFESWAGTIDSRNTKLLDKLHDIQNLIKSLEGDWESNAAVEIRSKIQGMEPRFQDYHDVVDNYAKVLRNAAEAYKVTEQTNTSNASQFV